MFFVVAASVLVANSAAAQSATIADAFRFSSAYGDGMVLQSAPKQAVVWGVTPFPDDEVTVHFEGTAIKATTALYGGNRTWKATLPATPASLTETYNISVTSSKSGSEAPPAQAEACVGHNHKTIRPSAFKTPIPKGGAYMRAQHLT